MYYSIFWSLVVIKLFLEMSNLLGMICLKCQILKEITRDGKYVKFVENPKASCFRVGTSLLENKYPIIDNIFVSYINSVKHNMSP
jgi:hypothetical protein